MNELLIFTDGSANPQSGVGYGASLAVEAHDKSLIELSKLVKIKRFENTSSTKLEIQTLLWALKLIAKPERKVIIHTDSQNILGLTARRITLEQNDYRSRNGKLIPNNELYQEFYSKIDTMECTFKKVQGHMKTEKKEYIDKLFSLVDRAARNALRKGKY